MQQEKNNVVMDTNIVVSAAISSDGTPARIFELFLEKSILNYTTDEIIDEISEVIDRPLLGIDKDYKKFILDNFKLLSVIIKPTFDEDAVPDKDDNKFINCALSAKADIISGDSHLLKLGSYKGVKILSAKQFLDKVL